MDADRYLCQRGSEVHVHRSVIHRIPADDQHRRELPAEPDRWDEQLTGDVYADIYQALPASERGAWLTSHGFVVDATKKQVSVIQGDVRGTVRLG